MKSFSAKINKKLQEIVATSKLYRSSVSTHDIWELYLNSMDTDKIWRDPESSVYNCNTCHNFIRRYGNIIGLDKDNNIVTMFDVTTSKEYQKAANAISKLLKESIILDVFFESLSNLKELKYDACKSNQQQFKLGVPENHKIYTAEEAAVFGKVNADDIYTFHHFHVDIPKAFVVKESVPALIGKYRDKQALLKRALNEISIDTYNLVLDLINQGSLLNSDSYKKLLEAMRDLKVKYDKVSGNKENWIWRESYELSEGTAHFKNSLIGVLCTELAEGKELNKACLDWNKRVDPANYMKAKAPITEAQKKLAQQFIEDNGYMESFDRRFATLDDVNVSEIKHMNVSKEGIKSVSVFDRVVTKSSQHKRNEFKNIEEVSIDKFMKDILPTCSQVELYLENKHAGNLVTLTTSKEKDVKPLFMWDNPFSWTYKGGLAGKSLLKEAVKKQGGDVSGVLRFSIMWAEDDIDDSDLDAHCIQPDGVEIYYAHSASRAGFLDIDVTQPQSHKRGRGVNEAVENIVFKDIRNMPVGIYKVFVHQFSNHRSQGFKAEVELNREIFQYTYTKALPYHANVAVAEISLNTSGEFHIKHMLPETPIKRELYGLDTLKFHKVNLLCLSPNYWGDNAVGNKHYFFMLNKCKTDEAIRSFHNENLNSELKKHRKVLDVLGEVTKIEPTDKQLSGVGFNATVRDEVILKLSGNFKRIIKVKF